MTFSLWLIGVIVSLIVSGLLMGLYSEKLFYVDPPSRYALYGTHRYRLDRSFDKEIFSSYVALALGLSLLWPAVLMIAIIVIAFGLPIYVCYKLGRWISSKRKKS
jgi:hypothetical protein